MKLRLRPSTAILLLLFTFHGVLSAENLGKRVSETVKRVTLDQAGTKPFHLRAEIAPTRERDKASGRTGVVEIWWVSPARFRREVRSPEFHQVEVIDGEHRWQKNEGDYFPEWLRETAIALIRPIPPIEDVLRMVPDADVKHMAGNTYISWMKLDSNGKIKHGVIGNVAITDNTGLLFYCGEVGWGALYKDYKDFHGRSVARTVSQGSPEVTAKITLEDLGNVAPEFFDAQAAGSVHLDTVVVDESELQHNLKSMDAVNWPALESGPLEGFVWAKATIDRSGNVRELGPIVSENPGVSATAREAFQKMRFDPITRNGVPVQAVSVIVLPFKSSRPIAQKPQ